MSTQTNVQLMDMVKGMAKAAVEELMAGMIITPAPGESGNSGPSSEDLTAMLDNLDVFK